MKGYLKGASIVHQCPRCFTLRDPVTEPEYCVSCIRLLNVYTTELTVLPLADVSDDSYGIPPEDILIITLAAIPNPPEC